MTTFTDLCRGGQLPNTEYCQSIKILSVAGATGGGNLKKTKSADQVIWHFLFQNRKELTEYLERFRRSKKKRDHRKTGEGIGKTVYFSQKVGARASFMASKRSQL